MAIAIPYPYAGQFSRQSAVVIRLPDPVNLRAGMAAVRARAARLGSSQHARRRALGILLREMQAGRSTAAAVAMANSALTGGQ